MPLNLGPRNRETIFAFYESSGRFTPCAFSLRRKRFPFYVALSELTSGKQRARKKSRSEAGGGRVERRTGNTLMAPQLGSALAKQTQRSSRCALLLARKRGGGLFSVKKEGHASDAGPLAHFARSDPMLFPLITNRLLECAVYCGSRARFTSGRRAALHLL